jgi:glycosyltransferase involved in cell wall biosynthesis
MSPAAAPDGPARRLALLLPDMAGGGAERVALSLAEAFLAAGHEVDLVLMRAEGELLPLVPAGVRIVDLGARRIRSVLRPLIRYLRSRRPDALQVSMWPLTVIAIVAHRLARSKARLVVSDHIALSRQYGRPASVFRLLRATTRIFYPWADARIVVSADAADDLASLSGIDRAGISVIYNPIPAPPADIATIPAIEALWGGAEARILTAGKLKEQKNQALLLTAFARLVRERAARLMILGDGPLRADLEGLADRLGVSDRVVFAGFILDPWPYYASADLFVLSSDYEGFGNVLVEAMRCGLPVVSTDCPSGPREILADGDYGRLVPVGDEQALAAAMAQMLDAPRAPERLRQRAEALSGAGASIQYLDLMLPGRPG